MAVKLTVKNAYRFRAETTLKTGGNKMQMVFKNQFGLAGIHPSHAQALPRPQVVNKVKRS